MLFHQGARMSESFWAKVIAGSIALIVKFPPILGVLMIAMTVDMASGIASAGSKGQISALVMRQGIWRKVAVLMACFAGYTVSYIIPPISLGGQTIGVNVGSFICGTFILSEFLSVLENVNQAGVNLPKPIQALMWKIRRIEVDQSTVIAPGMDSKETTTVIKDSSTTVVKVTK